MINDIRKTLTKSAKTLGDYQKISVEDLTNGYCSATDNNSPILRNAYISALILRYWYTIDKMSKKSANLGLEIDDFYMWLYDAIDLACQYRGWQNPENNVTADTCVKRCINTIRERYYYDANLDKHKANYSNPLSLEAPVEDTSEESLCLIDTLVSEESFTNSCNSYEDCDNARSIVQQIIDKQKIMEAIMLDVLMKEDYSKVETRIVKVHKNTKDVYKYTDTTSEFWTHKYIAALSKLPPDYAHYFSDKYIVAAEPLKAALSKIQSANNQKLYRYWRALIKNAPNILPSDILSLARKVQH